MHDHHLGPDSREDYRLEAEGPVEVFAKHGLRIPVYKLTLAEQEDWWSNDDPDAKNYMLVSLTPLPKQIAGAFADRLAKATEIALIQIVGDRLLDSIDKQDTVLSDSVRRLWVFMPDPVIYRSFHLSSLHASPDVLDQSICRWREYLTALRTRHPGADIKLGLFREPPYLGASFTDWERPDGVVHVSPYIWGVAGRDCPGYDLKWTGKNPSPIYEAYVQGLRYLHANTANSLD